MALMKKFKVEGLGRAEQVELDRELSEAAVDPAEIDYLVSLELKSERMLLIFSNKSNFDDFDR